MDCTPSCRLSSHAQAILSAITRENLAIFKQVVKRVCSNPANLTDRLGRHAIHVAASCGKTEILEWLLKECKVTVDLRDLENGWTALHRSLFYGQISCAEILLEHGADLSALDKEDLTPLDLLLLDSPFKLSTSVDAKVVASYDTKLDEELCLKLGDIITNIHMSGTSYWTGSLGDNRGFFPKSCVELVRQEYRSELFTWGSNTNFTLGHQDESLRQNPEMVETLSNKKTIGVIEVVMCKFHSVFLTQDGNVFTCGHGRGGRLGHNNEQTQLAPKKIDSLNEYRCVAIAAAQNHTVVVTDSGIVFTFGLNDMHQLGHSPSPPQCLQPRMVQVKSWRGKTIIGVSAGQYHSVMFTQNEVYTCGLNIGQLGHLKGDKFITAPRQVTSLHHKDIIIAMVTCADTATVCATSKGDIFVLTQYTCQKIITRFAELSRLVVSGGEVELNMNHEIVKHHDKISLTLLNGHGLVFQWKEAFGSLRKCKWMSRKELVVADVAVGKQMYIITAYGELYTCVKAGGDAPMVKPSRSASSPNQERDWDQKEVVVHYDVKRCPMVHRGTRIFTDHKSKGFAVLQVDPSTGVNSRPVISQSTMCKDFRQLLEETMVEDDIHDVTLVVKDRIIPAHQFILASKSSKFHHILIENNETSEHKDDNFKTVKLENVDYEDVINYVEGLYSGYKVDDTLLCGVKKNHKPAKNHGTVNQHEQQPKIQSNGSDHHLSHQPITDHSNGDDRFDFDFSGMLHNLESFSLPDFDDFSTMTSSKPQYVKKTKKKTEKKEICCKEQNINNKETKYKETKKTFKGLKFKRTNFPQLHDVTIESEDGVHFLCHKCVLISRLDYFRSMLACGWLETSKEMRVLNMPVNSSVLQVVLDYLYTDEAKILKNNQSIEFIGNVLVIADQLLIWRLREICETAMAKLISHKNVMELLEFSCVYNANQLKDSSLEFICNNLGSLLEAGYLGLLSRDTLDLLTKAYKDAIPRMPWRIIAPQSEHIYALTPEPSSTPTKRRRSSGRKRSVKSESEADGDTNVSKTVDESTNDGVFERVEDDEGKLAAEVKVENKLNKDDSREVHVDQVSSVATDSQDDDQGTWYHKKSNTVDYQQLSRHSSKHHNGHHKSPVTTKCKDTSPSTHQDEHLTPSCPWGSFASSPPSSGLKEIMQQELLTSPTTKIHKSNVTRTDVKEKMSQKQKKKAMKEREKENISCDREETTITTPKPVVNPWSLPDKNPTPVRSLRELIDQEEKSERALSKSFVNVSPNKVNGKASERSKENPLNKNTKLSWGLPHLEQNEIKDESSKSPKSAWQTVGSSPFMSVSFADILHLQERENTNLKRKKPLNLIQLEDRAIQELLDHYGGRDNACEMITVERIPTTSATPVWNRTKTESIMKT